MNFLSFITDNRKLRNAAFAVMAAGAAVGFSSCESFYFEEGDCDPHYYVKYVYNMNMEWADAFSSQVNSVELYVIDPKTGDLVGKYYEDDINRLSQPGYLMPVDLKPGTYDFVAWCGLTNNQEDLFSLPDVIEHRDHIHCTLARSFEGEKAFQNKQLNALFHGKINATLPDEQGDHIVEVSLIKNTNNINLSLQHISGLELTSDMFTVTMSEANGHLAHDNSLINDDEIEFRPWHIRSGAVDITGTKADDSANLNYFMAEISTSRLMADRDPRINIVENETGNVVYSIPIVQWATTFRSQQYKDVNNNIHTITDDQEYLDRESDYNIMLYLDNKKDGGWIAAAIYINSWKVVLQDADVH
ncbi:MAG: FimB/Mfa2 family fimbrial subunit [Muribaculaceae bacterium]|nr:FimB/Mfa2 family fimbrial subunit [Muribaculaceae bacterium]